jgi:hypothetical protein
MRPLLALAWTVALCTPLAACGPKSIVSTIWPEKHTVSSTVIFGDGAGRTTQTIRYGCKITDLTDSVAANVTREITGDSHWLKQPGGGILVLGRLDDCGVRGRKTGDARSIDVDSVAHTNESFLFNDAARPTEVRVLATRALFEGPEPRIAGARIDVVGTSPPTSTLEAAFPGLATLADPPPADADRRATPSTVFIGIKAEVFELTEGSRCETDEAGAGPIRLPKGHACQFLNRCRGPGDGGSRCGRQVGYLPVRLGRDWARAEITLGEPDPREIAVLHRQTTILAEGAPSQPGYKTRYWTPEACLDGRCVRLGGHMALPIRFYYPERGVLVELSVTQRPLWPAMFRR